MIRKFIFFCFLASALGRIALRNRPIHPIERTPGTRRELPKDVYDFLGNTPYLRSAEDFIKLPKELFEKWFAQNQPGGKMNDINLPEGTEVTTENLGLPNIALHDNNTDDVNDAKTDDFKGNPDVKEVKLKKVNVNKLGYIPYTNDYNINIKNNINDYNNNINAKQYQNNDNRGSNEVAVKQKLFELIKNTKLGIDKKIEPIQPVHDAYKMNRIYKIGYLISNINRTQDSLKDFYNHVEKNIRNWDVLKALNAYDQVKNADDFLSKALYILNLVGATTSYARVLSAAAPYTTTLKYGDGDDVTDRLAWSYYDDNM